MPGVIDDVTLNTIAAVGTPGEVGKTLAMRYGGLVDRLILVAPSDGAPGDPGGADAKLLPLLESLRAAVGE